MSQKITNEIQEAERSRDWSHIPNSEFLLAELKAYVDNLEEGILFTSDVIGYWKRTVLNIDKILKAQIQQQKSDVPWRFKDPEQIKETIRRETNLAQGEKIEECKYTPTNLII